MKPRSRNDTVALHEIAGVLRAIIERDEKHGINTAGLENARREIEWQAGKHLPPYKFAESEPEGANHG